jgi:peptide/nickel transport system permease protein
VRTRHKRTEPGSPSQVRIYWKRLRQVPTSVVGLGILALFMLTAIFGPWIAPYGYSEQLAEDRAQPPSAKHWLGTDQFGRDILSRIVVGSRDVFAVAGSGSLIGVLMGLNVGLFSGYYGGLLDEVIMRLLDVVVSLPPLMLAMVTLGTIGPSRLNVILVVGVLYIPLVARVVRSVVLDVKTQAFVEAAMLRGETSLYILFQEVLPNILPTLAVEASMRFTYAIFMVASLGFLGLGVQPPSADWGLMVGEAREWFRRAPWMLLFPAGAIALLVVGLSFLSDGLRRTLLPRVDGSDKSARRACTAGV